MSRLSQILCREIDSTGPIPFARFMELALYCPELGYYEGITTKIGQAGDFMTSPATGCLFGHLLGFQFAHWLAQISDQPVQVVEAGAHNGTLALDLLDWFQHHNQPLLDRLEYWILESSPARRAWQEHTLQPVHDKIRWLDSIESVPAGRLNGIIFSNEFLDALPVHRLGWDATQRRWFEWCVACEQGRFVWRRRPLQPAAFEDTLRTSELICPADLAALLPEDFSIEICPAAARWWATAAERLQRGFVLTFDYGMRGCDWFSPARIGGTVRAYRRHRLCDDVLANPGEQDITAHVNFSLLRNQGERGGLETVLFETQERFLNRVLRQAWNEQADFLVRTQDWKRQFQTLTHPDHLGRAFQVLVQQRPGPEL